MRLVLPTPREPIIIICSLKSAGLGGIFLRRDWAPRAGDEFSDPLPLPAALCGTSYLGSISISTFDELTGGNNILNEKWKSFYCQLTLISNEVWESLSLALSCCCSAISLAKQSDVTTHTSVSVESTVFIWLVRSYQIYVSKKITRSQTANTMQWTHKIFKHVFAWFVFIFWSISETV